MRVSTRKQIPIRLPCREKAGRLLSATDTLRPEAYTRQYDFSRSIEPQHKTIGQSVRLFSTRSSHNESLNHEQEQKSREPIPVVDTDDAATTHNASARRVKNNVTSDSGSRSPIEINQPRIRRLVSALTPPKVVLSEAQQKELQIVHDLRQKLSKGLSRVPQIKNDPSMLDGIPIDYILKALPQDNQLQEHQKFIKKLEEHWKGQTFGEVRNDLDTVTPYRDPKKRTVTDSKGQSILVQLGVTEDATSSSMQYTPFGTLNGSQQIGSPETSKVSRRQSLASMVAPPQKSEKKPVPKPAIKQEAKTPSFPLKKSQVDTVEASQLVLTLLTAEHTDTLPQLSFDLSRVLFNPGIYQLQDPRSRVYNFDPYLENIMPIEEFNFAALNPYLTSSEDNNLLALAKQHEKRYIGSSSSMTSVLSHFHFLISQWRELSLEHISRGFDESLRTFTAIGRTPAAIFLRYRDGVYAVDADKEYDEPNQLMSLGKSMEKLFTLEKADFEKWRRSNSTSDDQSIGDPEAFQYSHQGRFLLRSQLDVFDPRLPGTGYFDLKTRAVAGVRMNIHEIEAGKGYQIKDRFGTWESYEREYYDMMRSTFLKYSLQVRMGHMDGIFVAYHNIARMFGFQYIPISEMDMALHGQSDPSLGDQEFRFSINFMEEIFNRGTEAYPNQSLRVHFETREPSLVDTKPYMNVFIEPMSEEEITTIQESQKALHDAFEQQLLRGEDATITPEAESTLTGESNVQEPKDDFTTTEDDVGQLPVDTFVPRPSGPVSNAANKEYLNSILNTPRARSKIQPTNREVMMFKLTIQNKINNQAVMRPENISPAAKWKVEYQLEKKSDEEARKQYTICKNRRMSTLKTVMNRGSDSYFSRVMRDMSQKGAEWRRQQDELDEQRGKVILYQDRLTT